MRPVMLCAALAAACLLASTAEAVDRFGFGGFHGHGGFHSRGLDRGFGFFGYRSPSSLYGLGYIPVPPYYALHPPVYYSHPVPRPYGASPFARLPERYLEERVQERVMVNPFIPLQSDVDRDEPEDSEDVGTVAAANMIWNPYVSTPDTELAGR